MPIMKAWGWYPTATLEGLVSVKIGHTKSSITIHPLQFRGGGTVAEQDNMENWSPDMELGNVVVITTREGPETPLEFTLEVMTPSKDNCLFDSFGSSLTPPESGSTLRQLCADFWTGFYDLGTDGESIREFGRRNLPCSLTERAQELRSRGPKSWGGLEELVFLCFLFRARCGVYNRKELSLRLTLQIEPLEEPRNQCWLQQVGTHYTALHPRRQIRRALPIRSLDMSKWDEDEYQLAIEEDQERIQGSLLDVPIYPVRWAALQCTRFEQKVDLGWLYSGSPLAAAKDRHPDHEAVLAMDYWTRDGGCAKAFTTALSWASVSPRILPHSLPRVFYEVVPQDRPVRLYFDIEWLSHEPDGDWEKALPRTIQGLLRDLNPLAPPPKIKILKGSRGTLKGYKNSYHVHVPNWYFQNNTDEMRPIAQALERHPFFQGKMDTKVYTRGRLFRLPLCHKLDDESCTALTPLEEPIHCVGDLLDYIISVPMKDQDRMCSLGLSTIGNQNPAGSKTDNSQISDPSLAAQLGEEMRMMGLDYSVRENFIRTHQGGVRTLAQSESQSRCVTSQTVHSKAAAELMVDEAGTVWATCLSCRAPACRLGEIAARQFHALAGPAPACLSSPPLDCVALLDKQYPAETQITSGDELMHLRCTERIVIQGVCRDEIGGFVRWREGEWLSEAHVDAINQLWCLKMRWNWDVVGEVQRAPWVAPVRFFRELMKPRTPSEDIRGRVAALAPTLLEDKITAAVIPIMLRDTHMVVAILHRSSCSLDWVDSFAGVSHTEVRLLLELASIWSAGGRAQHSAWTVRYSRYRAQYDATSSGLFCLCNGWLRAGRWRDLDIVARPEWMLNLRGWLAILHWMTGSCLLKVDPGCSPHLVEDPLGVADPRQQQSLGDEFWTQFLALLKDGIRTEWAIWRDPKDPTSRKAVLVRGVAGPFPLTNVHKQHTPTSVQSQPRWKQQKMSRYSNHGTETRTPREEPITRADPTAIAPVVYLPGARGEVSPMKAEIGGGWSSMPHWPMDECPVLTLNMGACGFVQQIPQVVHLIRRLSPAVAVFQECRVDGSRLKKFRESLREHFPDYTNFVSTANHGGYWLSLISLIRKDLAPADSLSRCPDSELTGRLMSVRVPGNIRRKGFWVSNVHQAQADRPLDQKRLLRELDRRTAEAAELKYYHLVLGDFNATSHAEDRVGYANDSGTTKVQDADARFREFLVSNQKRGWPAVRIPSSEGDYTWKSLNGQKYARLDHVLVQSPEDESEGAGKVLTVAWPQHYTFSDHRPLVAFITARLTGRKPLQVGHKERVDVSLWSEHSQLWSEAVENRLQDTLEDDAPPGQIFEALDRTCKVMADLLPRTRTKPKGAGAAPHASLSQRRLERQLQSLGKAVEELDRQGPDGFKVTAAMRKSSHPMLEEMEGAECIPVLPQDPPTQPDLQMYRASLIQARKERRMLQKQILSQQLRSNRKEFRDMRSGKTNSSSIQFQRLLGKRVEIDPPYDRYSEDPSKQHPDTVHVSASPSVVGEWLGWVFGGELADKFGRWANTEGARNACFDGPQRVRIQRPAEEQFLITVRPIGFLSMLLRCRPLTVGEVALSCESPEAEYDSDILSQEETFFGSNALSARAGCVACHSPKIQILSESQHENLWYWCSKCHYMDTTYHQDPLPPCPLPDEIFDERQFPDHPCLKGDMSFEEFEALMFSRDGGSEAGEDLLSYKMWQVAPRRARKILYLAVRAMLRGHKLPRPRWKVAMVSLLLKKMYDTHLLEHVRPICLLRCGILKLFTTILAMRLGEVTERYHIQEEEQEGFRECRNCRRAHFKQQCLGREAARLQTSLFVTYLDFKNFFNSINKEVLFYLLQRLGMHSEDIELLRSYYEDMAFFVRNPFGDTCLIYMKGNGLHQGCPLSPGLGGIMILVLLRFLKHAGVGFCSPSGVKTNTTGFADDVTLISTTAREHQLLYQRVDVFCQWSLLIINLVKSEVTAYHFGLQQEMPVQGLQLAGGSPTYLPAREAFRHLGIRGSITGCYAKEKDHVRQETRRCIDALRESAVQLDPSLVDEVVRVAIVPIFRYSCPLVPWTAQELGEIARLWDSAYRVAWKVGPTFPAAPLRFPREHGGFQIPDPFAILARECQSLVSQIMELEDSVNLLLRNEVERAMKEYGVTTIAELQTELYLSVSPTTALPSLVHRMAWSFVVLGLQIDWQELHSGNEGTGLLAMTHMRRMEWLTAASRSTTPCATHRGPRNGRWLEFLKTVCLHGREGQSPAKIEWVEEEIRVVFPESSCSPMEASKLAGELRQLFGWRVTFDSTRHRKRPRSPPAQDATETRRRTRIPRISSNMAPTPPHAWDLSACIVGVKNHRLDVRGRMYRCLMTTFFSEQMRAWSQDSGSMTTAQVVRTLARQGAVFFLPAHFYPGPCHLPGQGWWVRAETAVQGPTKRLWLLRYVCLNRSEPVREGDIFADYGTSDLKHLIRYTLDQGWDGRSHWILEEDLLPRELPGNLPEIIQAYWLSVGSPPEEIQIRMRSQRNSALRLVADKGRLTCASPPHERAPSSAHSVPTNQSWLPGHREPAPGLPFIDCDITTAPTYRFSLPEVDG